jgi:hypothetical protein
MVILFILNEVNQQLATEREAIKDALNTCLRPESFMRLENFKVWAPAAASSNSSHFAFRPMYLNPCPAARRCGGEQIAYATLSSPPSSGCATAVKSLAEWKSRC